MVDDEKELRFRHPAPPNVPGYEALRDVLNRAYMQAAAGKGNERHSTGQPFHEQPICDISRMVGTGFATGQAIKKIEEAQRMEPEAAVRELLGAINYLAAAVIVTEEKNNNGRG